MSRVETDHLIVERDARGQTRIMVRIDDGTWRGYTLTRPQVANLRSLFAERLGVGPSELKEPKRRTEHA